MGDDLDSLLSRSAPSGAPYTRRIADEVEALTAAHADSGRPRRREWFPMHRVAVFTTAAAVLLTGGTAAVAAPALIAMFTPVVDRTSTHESGAAGTELCSIDWGIAPQAGVSADDPSVTTARAYLLSLDISSVTPDPRYTAGVANAELPDGHPGPTGTDVVNVALMATVADMVRTEVGRHGLDPDAYLLETSADCVEDAKP